MGQAINTGQRAMFLSIADFARAAGLCKSTITGFIKAGIIEVHRDGKRLILSAADLETVRAMILKQKEGDHV
mgnify:CR=1 FL=1